jgi:hypothetical protein
MDDFRNRRACPIGLFGTVGQRDFDFTHNKNQIKSVRTDTKPNFP